MTNACIEDYNGGDYEETTYDYELERPALELEDDLEDTLEVLKIQIIIFFSNKTQSIVNLLNVSRWSLL